MQLTIGTITDRGLNPKRAANEDRLLALADRGVFLVADGVGGRRAGQVASQTVVDVFTEIFNGDEGNPRARLEAAITESNRRIFDASVEDAELSGMATTLVALLIDVSDAVVAHAGDSRLYRYERGALHCETEDHSEIHDEVRKGLLSPALAAQDPRRNIITRALGVEPEIDVDYKSVQIREGARMLLCSDGITRHIPDSELETLLELHMHPQKLCAELKRICYERGAQDNLTAIIVDCGSFGYGAASVDAASAANGAVASGSRIEVDLRERRISGAPAEESKSPVLQASESPASGRSWVVRLCGLAALASVAFVSYHYRDAISVWSEDQLKRFGVNRSHSPAIGPQAVDPELAAARVLIEEKRYDKAREQLAALSARRAQNAEVHYLLGRANLELKNYPEAIGALNEAARLDAALPDVYLYLARAYEAIGDRRMKEESLRRAEMVR
ncbi:MAG: protein phosphatase 2C domain-containing protein [Acidobacteria bacterium]|nr:protein phosphatase 2C domain-containing protein [Acidobacteriota bacterium]